MSQPKSASTEARIRAADLIEASACEDLYAAGASMLGLSTRHVGGATALIAPRIPVSYFNRVIGLGLEQEATERDLDTIAAEFHAAGVRDYWVQLSPIARPGTIEEWLLRRHYVPAQRRAWAKFVHESGAATQAVSSLSVRRGAPSDAAVIGEIVCSAYGVPASLAPWFALLVGRPGWQFFVACEGARPVATGALYVREGLGWLGIGATLAEARRRGAQSALLAARIDAATAAGCHLIVTETGEPVGEEPNPSFANIQRAGFVQICSRLNFAAPAPESSSTRVVQ
jgi:hypothetical protein